MICQYLKNRQGIQGVTPWSIVGINYFTSTTCEQTMAFSYTMKIPDEQYTQEQIKR